MIDSNTLLFDDISVAWIEEWCRVAQFDSRQKLLMLSTALPQRVLLSLLKHGIPTKAGIAL